MDKTVTIFCENNSQSYQIAAGTTLKSLADMIYGDQSQIAAVVDNSFRGLGFELFYNHSVRFVTYYDPDGRRTYSRTLNFILQKAVSELYPGKVLICDYSLPNGLYCEIQNGSFTDEYVELTDEDVKALEVRMREIIARDSRFKREKTERDAAEKLFRERGQIQKAKLVDSIAERVVTIHTLEGYSDTFYGPLCYSAGYVRSFRLEKYYNGLCLMLPSRKDINAFDAPQEQNRISAMFRLHSDWCRTLGITGVGTLNAAIREGRSKEIITLCEARQERLYAAIADEIYNHKDTAKIVFIAGPSSSGKTSTSKRIANQCIIRGLTPKVVELDNYFVERSRTPKDENGEYDFESLQAMDIELLNRQLNQIIAGEEVQLPTFDFKKGEQLFKGNTLKLEDGDILIMEGIHALNPDMTPDVDRSKILRIYASELTSLSIDENNNISTIDTRLLRRIVRDNRTRGIDPESTILRWPSVRRGENRNIFPFQENADLYFNSALIYELAVLKHFTEPLLRRISPKSEAYNEAKRLLNFLKKIDPITHEDMAAIPPQSIMREFIGGQEL